MTSVAFVSLCAAYETESLLSFVSLILIIPKGMRNIDEAGYTMAKSAVVTLTRSFGQKG